MRLNEMRVLFLSFLFVQMCIEKCTVAQQQAPLRIKLDQGEVMGLKVFPDGAHAAVYTYLGVPYAEPPVKHLRFAPPVPHAGWNGTLHAVSLRAVCPQLSNTIYDETADGSIARAESFNEDCLFLNIWVTESGQNYGQLPVLVIITGEEMSYDWPRNRISGLDVATESVVVITVQYRSNIFGWISLDNAQLPGNYGLQDVQLALSWIEQNVPRFGGNPRQITLLGHGSGATLALATYLTPSSVDIAQLVLMSAGDVSYALADEQRSRVLAASRQLIQKLGCHFEERANQLVACLRMKSVSDLLRAYETVHHHGNSSQQLGVFMPQSLSALLLERAKSGAQLPPLMLGIASNEGAFLQDYWLDLAREGYRELNAYVNYTVLPHALRQVSGGNESVAARDAINWRYFGDEPATTAAVNGDVAQLMLAMSRLISESDYETPFYSLLKQLVANNQTAFAYVFHMEHAMDVRGKLNYFGGAAHSADLPLLFGPSLFKQIARRRFNADEERLCKKLRTAYVNFVKTGNPTVGRIYDAWLPYTHQQPFIYNLGEPLKDTEADTDGLQAHKAEIERLLAGEQRAAATYQRPSRNNYQSNYNTADVRRTKSSAAYNVNQQDSGYALHLRRVYGFWRVLLPMNAADSDGSSVLGQRVHLLEASADAARYRQGFFALLVLVCLLLVCLCLCVYLLRRDPLRMSQHEPSDGYSL